jgi:hypothetical protein
MSQIVDDLAKALTPPVNRTQVLRILFGFYGDDQNTVKSEFYKLGSEGHHPG